MRDHKHCTKDCKLKVNHTKCDCKCNCDKICSCQEPIEKPCIAWDNKTW